MGSFSSFSDGLGSTLSESDFSNSVANGDFVEVEPGKFQSREAAIFPLGALADAHKKGQAKPPSNVSGAFLVGGGDDDAAVERFRNLLINPKRHD